ncbi:hypothetical protein [Dactylosporangium sp. NPDC050588]|uniref:hypothetical protein n=1 Tax=Dactylosporangium sp. NPDC050588 TaxID=3157211 RepID=UPI0033D29EB2
MNIRRAGVVIAGLVLAVIGLASPAHAGIIVHDTAFPPGPTVTGDIQPVTWIIGPDI